MRHFTQVTDFSKQDYVEQFRRAAKFQAGGDWTHLAPGKVLGSLFFAESTRTSAGHKSAIISLGGGYLGIDGIKGTYLESSEEDLEDTILAFQESVDIMVVRHSTFDLINFVPKLRVPVINGMCGKDEHASAMGGFGYTLSKHFEDLSKLKVGVYGMVSASRPMKALYKLLAMFGATIIEDPILDVFACPEPQRKYVESQGSKLERGKYKDFIGDVDLFIVVEGLPQKGTDEKDVNAFNKRFETIDAKDLSALKKTSFFYGVQPRATTDGRLTTAKETDSDPRCLTMEFLRDWRYTIMALMTQLLEIKVP